MNINFQLLLVIIFLVLNLNECYQNHEKKLSVELRMDSRSYISLPNTSQLGKESPRREEEGGRGNGEGGQLRGSADVAG